VKELAPKLAKIGIIIKAFVSCMFCRLVDGLLAGNEIYKIPHTFWNGK
jgi:hypothetical protein